MDLNDIELAQYAVCLTRAARTLHHVMANGTPDQLITLTADIEFYAKRLGWRARDIKYRCGNVKNAEKT